MSAYQRRANLLSLHDQVLIVDVIILTNSILI